MTPPAAHGSVRPVPRLLTEEEIVRQLRDLPSWSRQSDGPGGEAAALVRTVRLEDWRSVGALVGEVADVAEQMDHHPDVALSWRSLRFTCRTHDAGGVTQFDVELAHRLEELLVDAGLDG